MWRKITSANTNITANRYLLCTLLKRQPLTWSYVFALQLDLGFCRTSWKDFVWYLFTHIHSFTTKRWIHYLLMDSVNSSLNAILRPFCMPKGCPFICLHDKQCGPSQEWQRHRSRLKKHIEEDDSVWRGLNQTR